MTDQSDTSGNPKLDVSIVPVTLDDVPALLRVHTAAFKTDQFSNLMLLGRDENAHANLMRDAIQEWIADPTAKLMQAVDTDGRVLGWSCWILKEATPTESEAEDPAATLVSDTSDSKPAPDTPAEETREKPKDPARVLGGLMYKDRVSMEDNHLKGKTYMVLQGLATDPLYQRRGIATKLIEKGLEGIDADGLPCWIHASPSSYTVYERAGFQEVGRNDYDLDEWAPGGKGGNRGWGRYTFRHMIRKAKHVGKAA
ncbi:putative acetyltransferase [Colletotrichum karsti]|uniref:Acetyltransferase n=1 Tax=Colletotrichum karsti TaxID=1095194 RepID=A0A9P6LGX5_9PEZI|nr:putative acetyltransferase [Colletotrichum karsti]KAF9875684.1 putative acetyltransferase [Colletotrichum karsti]